MLHLDAVSIDSNLQWGQKRIKRCLGMPEMSVVKDQISVHLASRNIDLAVGLKGAVVVAIVPEEQAASDPHVRSENFAGVAPVEIEPRNLGRREPNLLRDRALDHHDREWHVHVGEIERANHPRTK